MRELPLIARARIHGHRTAIRSQGTDFSYADLLAGSAGLAASLLGKNTDLAEARIALMAPAGFDYFVIQWAIWRAGGVAVPLSASATEPELEHVLGDAQAARVVAISDHAAKLAPLCGRLGLPLLALDATDVPVSGHLPEVDPARRAMILYTSGTTSKPKGVVTTHATIQAQIEALVTAWEWSADDRIPLFLPMHHVHGILNIGACALWSGATIETFPKFEMGAVLQRVGAGAYSVFMAVPTIYVKLIEALQSPEFHGPEIPNGFAGMRLMVSGSAALPPSVHAKWRALTGQSLLERYGMTETGMMISNSYRGERRQGSVGLPLPKVEIRLKSEIGNVIAAEDEPGEIQARGPAVFSEYWNRPETTSESFDDGWFRTGDMAVLENGYYRIMGRLSSDIIKSGGYKLSALEIEATLLEHPMIRECAVVGIKDDTWGEAVAVAVVFEAGSETLDLDALRRWGKERLSPYKLPTRLLPVEHLPRNAMGKVTKTAIRPLFDARPDR